MVGSLAGGFSALKVYPYRWDQMDAAPLRFFNLALHFQKILEYIVLFLDVQNQCPILIVQHSFIQGHCNMLVYELQVSFVVMWFRFFFSEDEEIDVVTVGERKVVQYHRRVLTTAPGVVSVMTLRKRAAPIPSTTPVNSAPASPVAAPPMSNSSMCAQVAAMHNYTAAPSSEPTSCSSTPNKRARVSHSGPPLKRIRINAHGDLRSVVHKLHSGHSSHRSHGSTKSSSRSSSDSEDSEGRRAQHNVLERKATERSQVQFSYPQR